MMRVRRTWLLAGALATFSGLGASGSAIYGRGSLDATGFDWVGMISGASGEVVGPNWVMTAKHVGGLDFWLNGTSYTALQRFDHPTADISLLYFANTFSGWYAPYFGDVLGQTLTYVGYGLTASYRTGTLTEPYPYTGYHMLPGTGGVKRRMTNTAGSIEVLDYGWGPAWITTCIGADLDFHDTRNTPVGSRVDTLKDGGATAEEGGLLYGDSGSPALVQVAGQWRVVGVNVDIEDRNGPNPGGDDNYLDFGDTMYSTSVAAYQGWITDTMSSVPEPASLIGLSIGALALLAKRRKR